MAAMTVKFLLTVCVVGSLGEMVRGQPDPGNPPQQWQDLVTLVYGKIEGMERLLAKKDERIDQLELNLASQTTEIMQLKRGMTSLEHAILLKDDVMEILATRVSDLETIVKFSSGEHESRQIARSHLPKTKNNETQLGLGKPSDSPSGSSVWKMSTSQPLIPQTSTYHNGSIMPTYSKQHIKDDDNHLLNQSYEDDTAAHIKKESEDLSTSKFSRFKQKRSAPPSLRQSVAFHVFLSSDKWISNDDVVVYDQVGLDIGVGYVPRLGIYVAPESGTYVITWTTLCYGQELLQTFLVLNGDIKGSSWTDSALSKDIHQTTAIVVLELNQGDHVFIRMGPTFGNGIILSRSDVAVSTFSGWKLD